MTKRVKFSYIDREISWLQFNGRVLQEARDPSVPLFDRLSFLAIFSSNLDEFFRVRVASLRSLLRLKKRSIEKLDFNPRKLLKQIYRIVTEQQEEFGHIFRDQILSELEGLGIFLIDEHEVSPEQDAFVRTYFREHIRSLIRPLVIRPGVEFPHLKDRSVFLLIELWPEGRERDDVDAEYGMVEVPRSVIPRFVWVPGSDHVQSVMFIEDMIRYNLSELFPACEVSAAYAVKLSRDADLYLEDEFSGNLVEKIKEGLDKRQTGMPCRLLYDLQMPYAMLTVLKEHLGLENDDLVPGGRYHNLHELHTFPRFGLKELSYPPFPPLPHPELEHVPSMLEAVARKDYLCHVPYQSFDYVVNFLREAGRNEEIDEIWIALYRVASDSAIVKALIEAAENGKRVTAFVEIKARFDEEPNLLWAERMEQAGIRVLYSMPGLKVHAKLALLVGRRNVDRPRMKFAYLSTGNFNEKTARIYTDLGLFTADPRITGEIRKVFGYLAGEEIEDAYRHLLVAPHHMRKAFYRLIDREIAHARAGREARMILKMNSLEDTKIISRLYRASNAGVQIDLIVRGICRLVPGVKGQSENIRVRSIVDRFLEHARIFLFHNAGDEEYYLASADWMRRNLSERVEVAFPVYDEQLRRELRDIIDLQLADDTKARIIDADQQNEYFRTENSPSARAQLDTYAYYKVKLGEIEQDQATTITDQTDQQVTRQVSEPVEIFLGRYRPFTSLGHDELEKVARVMQTVQVKAGEHLLSSDTPQSCLYIVREGELVLEMPDRPALRLGIGDIFNEANVVDPDVPEPEVQAVRDSVVLYLDARQLTGDAGLRSEISLKVLHDIARLSVEHLRSKEDSVYESEEVFPPLKSDNSPWGREDA